MNKTYTNSLFESIKNSMNKKETSAGFADFLKLTPDNTYVVRLIPNVNNPEQTSFHYYSHMWDSIVSNKKISVLCPYTYGERCPIDEYRTKIYKTEDKAEIERIKPLARGEYWLYNVYVVTDPTTPDNEGKVKILRVGKQLQKKIQDAICGEDADEYGAKIFDLSPEGVDLKIKVEKNEGGFANYSNSRFTGSKALPGNPDPEEIYGQIKSLDTIMQSKSYQEVKNLLDEHFLGKEVQFVAEEDQAPAEKETVYEKKVAKTEVETQPSEDKNPNESPAAGGKSEQELRMEEMLADLDAN